MPLYEYECKGCKSVFEVLQRINEEPLKKCIHCGGSVEKLISKSSFQFKGTGWYITDYTKNGSGSNTVNTKSESVNEPVGSNTEVKTTNVTTK